MTQAKYFFVVFFLDEKKTIRGMFLRTSVTEGFGLAVWFHCFNLGGETDMGKLVQTKPLMNV